MNSSEPIMRRKPGRSMSLREALRSAQAYLQEQGVADAAVDAWILLEHVTGISRAAFLADGMRPMEEMDAKRYFALVEKRASHIPLQHITGEQEFMGLTFRVNEHVLIPRQDTEVLVEETFAHLRPGMRVLDMCTGSGCIAVSLKKLWRRYGAGLSGNAQKDGAEEITVDAADISRDALFVAEENAARLGADIRLIQSDLFAQIGGTYDVIVSNPPYIESSEIEKLADEVRLHEPRQALDGTEDGLHFYRRILLEGTPHLKDGGWLLFEIGCGQAAQVAELMHRSGYEEIKVVQDLAGLDRVVAGRQKKIQEGIHV